MIRISNNNTLIFIPIRLANRQVLDAIFESLEAEKYMSDSHLDTSMELVLPKYLELLRVFCNIDFKVFEGARISFC